MDLLATRTVTFNEFLREEEQLALRREDESPLRPIPVLLAAGESMIDYERDFERWLCIRNVTLNSLESYPEVERLFRLDYTNSKFMEIRRRNIAMETCPGQVSVENTNERGVWKHNLGPNLRNSGDFLEYQGLRGRSELLNACVVPPDVFLQTMEHYGPNGRIQSEQPLRAIAIVLRPGETTAEYEENFRRWLSKKKVTRAVLEQDPEEERRFRQCFAYARAYEFKYRTRTRSEQHSLNQIFPRNNAFGKGKKRPRQDVKTTPTPQIESASGCQLKQLDEVVTHTGEADNDADSCTSSTTISEPPFTPQSADDGGPGDWRFPNVKLEQRVKIKQESRGNQAANSGHEDVTATIGIHAQASKSNADIYHAASLVLASSEEMDADSVEKDLVNDYVRSCGEIELNEAAIQDSLAHVKNMANVEIAETIRQIDELKEFVNQEKQRRDATLASVIAHEWKNKGNELEQLLLESVGNEEVETPHKNLVAIYEKLKQKRKEMVTLRIKLKNRLSWLKATDTDRDLQFQELRKISNTTAASMAYRSVLDEERRNLYLVLLRSNKTNRLLVIDAVEEAEHVWDTRD
ncbi:hypothetical protein PR003_g22546 [Phytophthora rubi]|uniref:Uncharacterized protein n=1 Tax=Phytophthora rubi TaxID=129364 RepID=A0A6A4D722_9STRA|nr:hypothetical protein PR001_g24574 [Phytophthora rubi]KAE9301335.1 hypothetical protein PR003_g22546 [Phytophthora rubi]